MRSDPGLRRWYRNFNRKWFGGGLPHDTIIFYETVDGSFGDCCRKEDGRFYVRINPNTTLDGRTRQLTLLHEMAHIRVHPYMRHGKLFESEMLRLATAGAFKGLW